MLDMDFDAHNREMKQVWEAFHAGSPVRVPVILGLNVRYYLLSPWLNPRKISFEEYSQYPDLMMETQVEFQHYVRHNLLQDAEMGMPKRPGPPSGLISRTTTRPPGSDVPCATTTGRFRIRRRS